MANGREASPCYGCPKRTATCHAQCPEYHEWAAGEKARPRRDDAREADGYIRDMAEKNRRKHMR